MQDRAIKLIETICQAWSRCLPPPQSDGAFYPVGDLTHCNEYVETVLAEYGYLKMAGLMANQMGDYLSLHTDDWLNVDGAVAQSRANEGGIVIAVWKNPTGGHGHVSLVFPGRLGSSGHWKTNSVPKLANVGALEFCRIGIGANWCFHDEPRYFVLKGTIQ